LKPKAEFAASPSERSQMPLRKAVGASFFSYLSWVSKKGKKKYLLLLEAEWRQKPLRKARDALLW